MKPSFDKPRSLYISCILLIVWSLINLLPYFLVPEFLLDFSMQHQMQGGALLVLFFFCLLFVFCLEAMISIFIFDLLKYRQNSRPLVNNLLRKVLLLAAYLFITAYYLTIIGSWYIYTKIGVFIGAESLSLISFLTDYKTFLVAASREDTLRIILAFILAALVSYVLFVFSKSINSIIAAFKRFSLIVLIALLLIFLPKFQISRLDNERRVYYSSLVNNFFSPQLSYIWGPIWFGISPNSYDTAELKLEKRYNLKEYLSHQAPKKSGKNVLLIMVEALRADVIGKSINGHAIMPTLNEIAARGIEFKHAYADGNETCYGQAAILTGLYQHKFPYRDMRRDLNYPFVRIYDVLSGFGYNTAYFTQEWATTRKLTESSLLGLRVDPENIPQSEILRLVPQAEKGYLTPATIDRYNTARFKEWVSAQASHSSQMPWFASLYFYASHYPYEPPSNFEEKFAPNRLPSTDDVSFLKYPPEYAPIMLNRYHNALNFIDGLLDEVVSQLEAKGHLENTTIIVTGDHGELFHEHGLVGHGGKLYQEVINIPLIISGSLNPDYQPRINEAVSQVDIAPTILEIVGLSQHGNFQGRSLLSRQPGNKNKIFSSVQLMIQEDCVISLPWKYCFNQRQNAERLFNLSEDPYEKNNMIGLGMASLGALKKSLKDFRDTQLTYYDRKNGYRDDYFPPSY